jgi:Zn-dependent protease with chaperone function
MRAQLVLSLLLSLMLPTVETRPAAYAASSSDLRMVGIVAARIFAEAEPVEGWVWPPLVAISDINDVNAFASTYDVKPGQLPKVENEGNLTWVTLPKLAQAEGDDALGAADADSRAANASEDAPSGGTQLNVVQPGNATVDEAGIVQHEDGTVTQPIIVLYQGFLDRVVQSNPDRLAAVFGHEAAHILLRHVDAAPPRTPLVANMITRDQEAAADMLGMKLGLASGFPYNGLISGFLGMREQGNYNSFEGLNASHPGWTDRVAMVDERQPELWRSISAFENGVYFLTMEQYQLAEECFNQVVKECPKCYEAWANLGYARLMRYCDKLDAEDLRSFDVGQLVVGGFYRRPASLEPPSRGKDAKLWLDAVGALRQALILNPDLVLAKANLAAAYLIAPDGKDVGQAEELFTQVTAALESGNVEELEPTVHASLLVNAGVAEIASGDPAAAEMLFAQAQALYGGNDAEAADSSVVAGAIRFNRGRMYAAAGDAAQRQSAIEQLEAYLASTSSASNWWPLAYEQYEKLCDEVSVAAKNEDELRVAANTQYRLVTGIALPDGGVITLNDPLTELEKSLGKGREQKIVKNSNVRRLQYPKLGLDLLCANRVVAIRLRGPQAPPLMIRASGAGGKSHAIRPGMTVSELDLLLGGDATQWDERYGATSQIVYRFYSRLGFGVRLGGDKIVEIIVAQIPIEAKRM